MSVGGVPPLAFGTTQVSLLSEVPLGVASLLSDEGHGGSRIVESGMIVEERRLAMNHANGAHTNNRGRGERAA